MNEGINNPKFVDNQLSSMEFRGLASDCFCHHWTIYCHCNSYILKANLKKANINIFEFTCVFNECIRHLR
jgi:hypothetical protein